MNHPHFVLGLSMGVAISSLTLIVAAFLYGTNRISPDLATQQMPFYEKCQSYATGKFTGP